MRDNPAFEYVGALTGEFGDDQPRRRWGKVAIVFGAGLLAFGLWLAGASAQDAPKVTVFACPVTTITTGGTAVTAIPSSVNGAIIANFPDATENLFVDQTKTATTTESATNYPIQPGQPWFVVPKAVGQAGSNPPGVSVNAASSSHAFFCVMW